MSRLFFDTDSKSFTFIYYLKQVQRNLEFFTVSKMQIRRGLPVDYWLLREAKDLEASQLNDHRKKLNKIKAELSDIKHERDKRHAHLDRETLDASLQRVDLNQNDALDRLLGLACRAFNTISSCHSGKTFVFTPMDINDIQNTLWRVRAYLRSEQPDLIE
jgi:exopolyphosphatase/pppGpp-phosphohydrolase